MRVILAETAGFCYGVERAVRLAEQTAREKGGCVMLGSIIHNDKVVGQLEALGARQVQSVEDVHPGDTVLLRAHGERAEVIRALEAKGVGVIDAACPHVLRIHRLVEQAEKQGRTPLIIGDTYLIPCFYYTRTGFELEDLCRTFFVNKLSPSITP